MAKWMRAPLGEVADLCLGKMLDQNKNRGEPLPYLANVNVRWGEFALGDLRTMRFETHELERYGLKFGDIVMCEGGEPGRCAIWKEQIPGMMIQKALHRIRPKDLLDFRFLYYNLLHIGHARGFDKYFTGATIKHLPGEKLAKVEVDLPPLPVQQRIAGILSTYDDLIENNQRRIKILESMARALYREWFVNFRFPGHEGHPRVPSSLGEIPKGWKVKKLGEVLELNYGKALKKEDRRDGEFPVYGSSGVVGTHDTALTNGPGIVVGRKGNVGSVFWCDEDFFVIDTAFFVTSSMSLRYLVYVLPTLNFINSDSAVPGLSRNQAYTLDILVPPDSLLKQFCELADTFERQASTLRRQSNNLRYTRDLLLPRLLSGQIDVSAGLPEVDSLLAPVRATSPSRPVALPILDTPAPETPALRQQPVRPTSTSNREELEPETVLATIRQLFGEGTARDHDTALRELAQAMGYQRLGKRIKEDLSSALLTAVRRGILTSDRSEYTLNFRSLEECDRDSLKADFLSSLGRAWTPRTEAIQAFARYLGFARVGHVIDDTARSLINGLIREGRLETDGPDHIRRT